MKIIEIDSLGSSSSGCCYILKMSGNKIIVLDCGLDVGNSQFACDLSIITHAHWDHASRSYFYEKRSKQHLSIHPINFDNGWVKIRSFPLEHGVENYGIYLETDESKILYITDTYQPYIPDWINPEEITDLFLEANHDYYVKKTRGLDPSHIVNAAQHSSNLVAYKFICDYKISQKCRIYFIHESESNYSKIADNIFNALPHKWVRLSPKGRNIIYPFNMSKIMLTVPKSP